MIREAAVSLIDRASEEDLAPVFPTVELIEKKLADTKWLVVVLHVLNDKHEIFSKEYYYLRPARNLTLNSMPVV